VSFTKLSKNYKITSWVYTGKRPSKIFFSSVFPTKAIRYIFYAFDEVYVQHCAVLALTRWHYCRPRGKFDLCYRMCSFTVSGANWKAAQVRTSCVRRFQDTESYPEQTVQVCHWNWWEFAAVCSNCESLLYSCVNHDSNVWNLQSVQRGCSVQSLWGKFNLKIVDEMSCVNAMHVIFVSFH